MPVSGMYNRCVICKLCPSRPQVGLYSTNGLFSCSRYLPNVGFESQLHNHTKSDRYSRHQGIRMRLRSDELHNTLNDQSPDIIILVMYQEPVSGGGRKWN